MKWKKRLLPGAGASRDDTLLDKKNSNQRMKESLLESRRKKEILKKIGRLQRAYSLQLNLTGMYGYLCVCVCIHIYIHLNIHL
jgi:hypothetical protein